MRLFSGSFEDSTMVDDFFRNRLDQMIDLRHPLAVLANRMPWQEIEASLAQRWARQAKAGKKIEGLDLFGPVSVVAGGGTSNAGRPRLPTRLMVALLYLKHAFNESDEEVIQRWGETPTWQYFSGNEYFEHQWPCDPTQLGRFRKASGEEGAEELLARTMEVAVTLKLIARKELARVIVDSTVQEKAVAHPTDSKVVEAAKANGIELKKTYAKEGLHLSFKAGRYAHARQFRRMRKAILMQGLGVKPEVIYADLGYRGVDKDNPGVEIKHRGKDKRLTEDERRLLKRPQAIEPIIGHLKGRLSNGPLPPQGHRGDAIYAVLCAAGYNIRWLLRMIDKKGLGLLLCLLQAAGLTALVVKFAQMFSQQGLKSSDQRWALA
jgi:hypothetical protein